MVKYLSCKSKRKDEIASANLQLIHEILSNETARISWLQSDSAQSDLENIYFLYTPSNFTLEFEQ